MAVARAEIAEPSRQGRFGAGVPGRIVEATVGPARRARAAARIAAGADAGPVDPVVSAMRGPFVRPGDVHVRLSIRGSGLTTPKIGLRDPGRPCEYGDVGDGPYVGAQ